MKMIAIGNFQCVTFANLAQRMLPEHIVEHYQLHSTSAKLSAVVSAFDVVFVQPQIFDLMDENTRSSTAIHKFPRCSFSGFHPDMIYLSYDGRGYISTASHHSAIIFGAWANGLNEYETEKIFFDENLFRALQFERYFAGTETALMLEWSNCGLDARPYFERWMNSKTPFMLTMNHPRLNVLHDMTRAVLEKHGFAVIEKIDLPHHHLEDLATWPVYPCIAEYYGKVGSLEFIRNAAPGRERSVGLRDFITSCFAIYGTCDKAKFSKNKSTSPLYQSYFDGRSRRASRPSSRSHHPYQSIKPHQHWRNSFSGKSIAEIDPVVELDFKIGRSDRIATAGSCFAQHLANALVGSGLNYFVPEAGDRAMGYGLFSARYGNIYTTLQLAQLIDRAYGAFEPEDIAWEKPDGTFIDPFRPEIPLLRNATPDDVQADRQQHFAHVRTMLEEMNYFVFTLGLTECWLSKADGAAFPLAPGVVGGAMDFAKYEFCNLDEAETYRYLQKSITKIRALNPEAKVILTVSPVPLMATYENRHVLSSTTYSKAVLRVAAERATREFKDVYYFPSYEIVTGTYNRGSYFDADLRTVTPQGVDHVMSLFLKHATLNAQAGDEQARQISEDMNILCAEELLDLKD